MLDGKKTDRNGPSMPDSHKKQIKIILVNLEIGKKPGLKPDKGKLRRRLRKGDLTVEHVTGSLTQLKMKRRQKRRKSGPLLPR